MADLAAESESSLVVLPRLGQPAQGIEDVAQVHRGAGLRLLVAARECKLQRTAVGRLRLLVTGGMQEERAERPRRLSLHFLVARLLGQALRLSPALLLPRAAAHQVERERQARLETERARRRQALLRERQLDEDVSVDIETDQHSVDRHLGPSISPTPESLPVAALSQTDDRVGGINGTGQTEGQSADAGLSYPMERFLESSQVVDEAPSGFPVETSAPDDAAASTLPYTMELFLAETVAAPNGVAVPDNEEMLVPSHADDVDAGEVESDEQSILPNNNNQEDANPNQDLSSQATERSEGEHDNQSPPSRSVASLAASTDGHSLHDHMSAASSLANDQDLRASTASSPSLASAVPSQDSFDVNSRPPRLTEADVAQLEQLEHASIGNAAPLSVREEPSESSVAGREPFVDHAFSVATQTTVIESVTEASDGRRGIAFSDIDESEESLNVVRIGSAGSVQYSASPPDGANSASIEAMPSSEASGVSASVGRLGRLPSEEMSDSITRSFAPSSHPSSSDDIVQLHQLTENDIVAMDEIDYASIGNAPPLSVRDERLSESSVASIPERGLQFGVTTIAEVGSVDSLSNQENASAHSIAAMPSERDQDEILASDDEDMLIYQASVGSSASIEALPSVDLEHDARSLDYGSIRHPSVDGFSEDVNGEHDIESAPLLSGRSNGLHLESISEAEKRPQVSIAPALILGMAELPTFIALGQSNEQLNSELGVKRHQLVLASIVVVIAAVNHSKVPEPGPSRIGAELQAAASIGTLLGLLIGLVGFLLSDFDIWLGTVNWISIAAATVVSSMCNLLLIRAIQTLDERHGRANAWVGPAMTGCRDLVACLVILQISRLLL